MDDIRKHEPLFGSWTVDRVIGEGSYGKVYALKKTDFGKDYFSALKVISVPQNESEISSLRSEGMDDESIRNHFKQFVAEVVSEFDLMARFRGNSNIVSYEDHLLIPSEDGYGYNILIRMELLTSLVSVLEKNEFSKKDVIQLGIDMCKALELCQKHDIIHRDIKPENIFVSNNGDYKLGDFGIARTVEKTGGEMSKKGTYTYMAPEVYKSEPYGSDVDIYSLGIVLYRLLNGNRTPFLPLHPAPITHTDRENALLRRISGARIPPPSGAGGRLAEIVMKSIEYKAKDRFISPYQMRKELETISYNENEGQIIYPMGDRIELPKNQYASGSVLSPTPTPTPTPQPRPQPQTPQPRPAAPAGYAAGKPEPSANRNAYPPQGTVGGSTGYPQQRTPAGSVGYPPQAMTGGSAGYPPQRAPTGGAGYPQQTASGVGAQNPQRDLDATVADVSGRGTAYTAANTIPPVNTVPPASTYPPPNAPPPVNTAPTANAKPWLKWAIIAGSAVIVIVVVIIILVSSSNKKPDDDPSISSGVVSPTNQTETPPTPETETPPTPETETPPTPETETPPTPETETPPTPETQTPTPEIETPPSPSNADLDAVSLKVWADINNDTYQEFEVGTDYEIIPGVTLYITEVGPVTTDYNELYVAVGLVISNSLEYNTISIEDRDFVCAAIYGNNYDDYKPADIVLNIQDEPISFPIDIPPEDYIYLSLGFLIPDNTDYAVFAYTNVWGDDFSGESYIYIMSGY